MIQNIKIRNFKSIPDLSLDLSRVTLLIGANGSGKSNILEAIAFASVASQNKLDNEFLSSRGIRVTETRFMRSAFQELVASRENGNGSSSGGNEASHAGAKSKDSISIAVVGDDGVAFEGDLIADETDSYSRWTLPLSSVLRNALDKAYKDDPEDKGRRASMEAAVAAIFTKLNVHFAGALPGFLVYSPENSAMRTFQSEGQVLPLGIKGEGLFAHLKGLNTEKNRPYLTKIKETLALIDWFDSFDIPENLSPGERSIRIHDRFLPEGALFDQRSANEGFLFLLFYITLFVSPDTPAFFAIDNVDSSLNPKLCIALIQQLVALAKEHDKQVILTTHNPALLDGINLGDEAQRLLVVERNKLGHTHVRRIDPPKTTAGQAPVSLSEAFMRGYIGGLPKNF